MIVYVESNFVLEIALEQKQASAARSILSLAESHQIELAYPSFVLSEPFDSIMRTRREYDVLRQSLLKALNDLKRSEPHKQVALDFKPALNVLENVCIRQIDLLYSTFEQLLSIGRCINIDVLIFKDAAPYRSSLALS